MKYILDSSVGFKWEVREADSDKALRDEKRKGLHELHAPDAFSVEIAHALTRAERQRRITPAQGAISLGGYLSDLPTLHQSLLLLPRAYAIRPRPGRAFMIVSMWHWQSKRIAN
jgi:predicted nucleic acid-binding protein